MISQFLMLLAVGSAAWSPTAADRIDEHWGSQFANPRVGLELGGAQPLSVEWAEFASLQSDSPPTPRLWLAQSDEIGQAAEAVGEASDAYDTAQSVANQVQSGSVNVTDVWGVPVWLPFAFSGWQLGEFFRVYDGYRAIDWIRFIGYGYAGLFTAYSVLFPSFATEESANPQKPSLSFDYSLYLVDTSRKGDLTGEARKRAEGMGLGSHIDVRRYYQEWGLSWSLKLDWQQVNLDSNDFLHLTNFFYKLDPLVGVDLTTLIAKALPDSWTGLRGWLNTCVLEGRIGPSIFGDWIRIGDIYGSDKRFYDNLSRSVPLMQGLGWEYAARADINLFIMHVEGFIEGGYYPKLRYPGLSVDNYRMVRMIAFDKLRGQDSYRWYKYKLVVDTPFPWIAGKRWAHNSRLKAGYEIFRLEGNEGEGLNNQAYTLSAQWSF